MIKLRRTDFPALEFVDLADQDYIAARLLTFSGKPLWRLAAYHSHQAIEKYLKSLIIQLTGGYLETHELIKLAKCACRYFSDLNNTDYVKSLEKFDEQEQVSRYGPFAKYDPLSKVERGQFQTKGVYVWSDNYILDLDRIVYETRRFVEYNSQHERDGLKAILNENKNHKLIVGWKLPHISILDILTSHNNYFKKKL